MKKKWLVFCRVFFPFNSDILLVLLWALLLPTVLFTPEKLSQDVRLYRLNLLPKL